MTAAGRVPRAKPRIRLTADARSRIIVDAALRAIAAEGFEGLRTRDIAASVDINSATLHHHFPTKADLVAAVAEELKSRFQSGKAPSTGAAPHTAITALERQFADADHYRLHHPELLAAYREFVARAPRDPMIARLVKQLNDTWRQDILKILKQARREGVLRSTLDPEAGSHIVLNTVWGLTTSAQPARAIHQVTRQLLALLIQPAD